MKTRVLAAVLLMVCVRAGSAGDAQTYDDRRRISVNGEAVVKVRPDKIVVTFGIQTLDRDVIAAKQQNNGILKNAVAAARDLGIPEKDIQTDHLSVSPKYKFGEEYEAEGFVGYLVRNRRTTPDRHGPTSPTGSAGAAIAGCHRT